jgi:hypothetical protein
LESPRFSGFWLLFWFFSSTLAQEDESSNLGTREGGCSDHIGKKFAI